MKKIFITGAAALLVAGFAGCSKFLEEHSQNASYIESPADLEELLYGDALGAADNTDQRYLHLLADESKELYHSGQSGTAINESSTLMSSAGLFRWYRNPFTNFTGTTASSIKHEWDQFYEIIAVANSLIENSEKFDRSDPQVAYIKGSAYFLRALNYFRLVNIYGEPYSKADPTASVGVPWHGVSKVDQEKQVRQNTGYIYDRIVEDLAAAAGLLEASGDYARSQFKVSADAVWALLSRVYLYMERYDDAIESADNVDNLTLYDLVADYPVGQAEVFLHTFNPEIIFAQGNAGLDWLMPGTGFSQPLYDGRFEVTVKADAYCVDDELFALFTEDDVRLSAFFALSYELNEPMVRKFRPLLGATITETDPLNGDVIHSNIEPAEFSECGVLRAAEVVLNKAEAQACAGNAEAVVTITEFVNTRYATPPAVPSGGNALIEFIRNERRKELCFEGHRWFDLRRYAVNTAYPQTTAITHEYYGTVANATLIRGSYILEPYSETTKGNWVLPIPPGEIDFNWPQITDLDRTVGVTHITY